MAGEEVDAAAYDEQLSEAVAAISRKQAELGIDVINDGEFGKPSSGAIDYGAWQSYAWARLSGWEPGEQRPPPALANRRDRINFADFYNELDSGSFRSSNASMARPPVVTGPLTYIGHEAIGRDVKNFDMAFSPVAAKEAFMTAVAPGSFARRQNEYYKSDEEFLFSLGEALREEYTTIIDAGFILQLDDPGLPDSWDMANPEPESDEYRKFASLRIEALFAADRSRKRSCGRGWKCAARTRMEGLARCLSARWQGTDPWMCQSRHQRC
jgi:5-methyltetrahydropteroyltriglutamate--homocysteine methyltransferase